ncbi:LysR substrate-binding domain-containing protein [Veronia pacifica]|uniref:LysR family transcriptional regulator n=1 Tax=Veronia pacifica TaxID=1080227 RepID=A0A1C3EQ27_9GAMM|nr:LysR substrate-binding domain-containing protein [Veronia pacifica]ODA35341.1 LysR family transcriptional regulator [Veronia pacifica]
MKKRLPPLNWLRSFEAAARHLSFTHASEELHITQAAISQQIKGLESQLGTTLFIRLPRGLRLTEAGSAYLPVVHEAISKLSEITEELFGQGRNKLLTIRVNLVFFINWLSPRLQLFRDLHPQVNLKITSNIWFDGADRKHDADLEVVYGNGRWSDLEARRLTWDTLFPICSPDFRASLPDELTPELLQKQRLLHVIGYEDGWGHWFNRMQVINAEFDQGCQFDTLVNALEVAANHGGIALGRSSLAERYINEKRLVRLFDENVITCEAFYLANSKTKILHPHASLFIDWIMSEVESDINNINNKPLYN